MYSFVFYQALAIETHTGRLFILTYNGTSASLQIRATSDGAVIRTFPTGEGPVAFTVDEPRGRVFVQNAPTAASRGNGMATMLDARTGAMVGLCRCRGAGCSAFAIPVARVVVHVRGQSSE